MSVQRPWTVDKRWLPNMKSQDILLLLKLASIERATASHGAVWDVSRGYLQLPDKFRGWEDRLYGEDHPRESFQEDALSVRGLSEATGISKSEVSNAIRRCTSVGLAKTSRKTGKLSANAQALFGLICNGIKYIFPASVGSMARGVPTGISAPIVKDKVFSSTDQSYVWEDPLGREMGLSVSPIYKSVTYAVRRDPDLYAMLALVDSIRIGQEREARIAKETLARFLGQQVASKEEV